MTTKLRKLRFTYCTIEDLPVQSVALLFDGKEIHDSDTPQSLGMKENDVTGRKRGKMKKKYKHIIQKRKVCRKSF